MAPDVREQLLVVLDEAVEGPPGNSSWFTESRPGSGFLGSVRLLSPAQASRPLGGSTVAAHVHHVVFAMRASTAWIRGDREPRDWASSWSTTEVDAAAWDAVRAEISTAHRDLRQAILDHALDSDDSLTGAIASVAHLAAHLGAVRQKILLLHDYD